MNSKNDVWLKTSGVSGILAPIIAFTLISLAIVSCPQFSWTEDALSDLGVQEGVTAILFNSGLMIAGILALIFAMGLFMFLSENALGRISALILALAALALIAVGIFPESVKPTHYYVSVAFFVLLLLSMLFMGAAFLRVSRMKVGLFAFLTVAVATVVWIIQFLRPFVSGVAIPEIISALSASMWSIALGFRMLKHASHPNKRHVYLFIL